MIGKKDAGRDYLLPGKDSPAACPSAGTEK